MRHAERVWISLFALTLSIAASRTVAAGDWPKTNIVRNGSESPDGRYAVLVLSKHPKTFTGSAFSSEEEKAAYLDKLMNDVYQAVRFLVPANRLTRVKQEQVAWLKTRDGAHPVDEKSQLTESRVKRFKICFGDV